MYRLLISQKCVTDQYGQYTDVLEKAYTIFFNKLGMSVYPVSSFVEDPEEYLNGVQYDGLVLSGGGNVDSRLGGLDNRSCSLVNLTDRDRVEYFLIKKMIKEQKPILGICRGMQQINCYFGGSITVDIFSGEKTARAPGNNHSVRIKKDVCGLSGEYEVNHYHDHGVRNKQVASCFDILAVDSECDVVESILHKDIPILGMQWHPERESPEKELNEKLVRYLFRGMDGE